MLKGGKANPLGATMQISSPISSRTPEGEPNCCSVCGSQIIVEPSLGTRDAPCPRCGHLLWWLKKKYPEASSIEFVWDSPLADIFEEDSLETVEFIMELEEEFDIKVTDEDAARIRTVGDAIRYIEEKRPGGMSV